MRRFFGLALLSLLAIPPPAHAGSISTITYEFRTQLFPHHAAGMIVVDGSALSRGYFTRADVTGFGFQPFVTTDLDPFSVAIGGDGIPTSEGILGALRDLFGTTYTLQVDFGPASFVPTGGGYYQVSGDGTPGVDGYGWWSVTIAASASVPEPSTLAMACLAGACVLAAKRAIHHTEDRAR